MFIIHSKMYARRCLESRRGSVARGRFGKQNLNILSKEDIAIFVAKFGLHYPIK